MLRNQLALTEGLKDNQRAITQGFSQFERLADMQELPGVEAIEDEDKDEDEEPKKEGYTLYLEKNVNDSDLALLRNSDYIRPNDFYDTDVKDLEAQLEDVNSDIKSLTGQINGRKRSKNPTPDYIVETKEIKEIKETLIKYKKIMNDYFKSLEYKVGQGLYFSPQELLKRFELLSGSLAAGNNGVLPEYIQLAHRLRDLKVITNNQLNNLIKNIHYLH